MTDATKLAESLRAMRRNAQMHYSTATTYRHSITLDSTRLGDLSDAADLIEKQVAEIKALKEVPAVLLTVDEIRDAVRPMYASAEAADMGLSDDEATARLIESAVLRKNGKAVS